MFQKIRRIFSRIRLVMNGVRSAIFGIAVVATTWIVALPASKAEIARLQLTSDTSANADGLRDYRMAKLLLLVGTDRTFDLIARQSGSGITGDEFQLALQISVNGIPSQAAPARQSGAKFVTARTD